MSSSLLLNTTLFRWYKNHTTVKGLVGIAPSRAITFLSQFYTGSISDRERNSRKNCRNTRLSFRWWWWFYGHYDQMPPENVVKTQIIASLRIHVERAINKIKLKFPYLGPSKTPFPIPYIKPNVVSFWVNFLCNVQRSHFIVIVNVSHLNILLK